MVEPMAEEWSRVADRIAAEMEIRAWRPNNVYLEGKVDPKSLARVLDGHRPRGDVARKLAAVFGWREDGLVRIARGLEPERALNGEVDRRLSAVESDLAEVRRDVQRLLDQEAGGPPS